MPAVLVARDFNEFDALPLSLVPGMPEPDEVRRCLANGGVVIGSVLAQRSGRKLGDEIVLQGGGGLQSFQISAIAVEYSVGGLTVVMERSEAQKKFHLEGADAYVIHAKHDAATLASVDKALQDYCQDHGLMVHSNVQLSRIVDDVMNPVIEGLWGLLGLGFVVAGFGITNTLTMNVLEQTREIALLRAIAVTCRQIRKMIFSQAAVIGLMSLVVGAIAGMNTAFTISRAMVPLLGYPIPFRMHPWLLLSTGVGTMLVVLAAAWFPARRATRLDLLAALQYE